MAAAIQDAHPEATVDIAPGGKGDFIVESDGTQLWNKRSMGDEFPEHAAILARLGG